MKFRMLLLLPLLAACSSAPEVTSLLSPYRIDVRQGNYISQEMVAQLKSGQSRDQVRFILGSPLVTDVFHADRWDYIYRFKPGGSGEIQERRLTVFFDNNKLSRVTGDVVANDTGTGADGQQRPATRRVIEIGNPAVAQEQQEKTQ